MSARIEDERGKEIGEVYGDTIRLHGRDFGYLRGGNICANVNGLPPVGFIDGDYVKHSDRSKAGYLQRDSWRGYDRIMRLQDLGGEEHAGYVVGGDGQERMLAVAALVLRW